MASKNENVTKIGGTKINISNSMSTPVKLMLGGITAAGLTLGGGFGGAALSKADQEAKLDKILEIVIETKERVIKLETTIKYIERDVNQNKQDIKRKQ